MKLLNALFRLFGYEWVKDETPYQKDDDPITDEGWDDLYEHSPRYKLRKINQKPK